MKRLLLVLLLIASMASGASISDGARDHGAARLDLSNVSGAEDLTLSDRVKAAFAEMGAGTAAAPAYSFSSDPDTGIYSPGANSIGLSVGGVMSMKLNGGSRLQLGVSTDDGFSSLQTGSTIRNFNIDARLTLGSRETTYGEWTINRRNDTAFYSLGGLTFFNNAVGGDPGVLAAPLFLRDDGTIIMQASTLGASKNVLIATSTDDGANKLQVNGSMRLIGGAAPTATEGGIYFNSTDKHFYGYNGTAWVQLDN